MEFDFIHQPKFGSKWFQKDLANYLGRCLLFGVNLFCEVTIGEPSLPKQFLSLVYFDRFFSIDFVNVLNNLNMLGGQVAWGTFSLASLHSFFLWQFEIHELKPI